MSETTTLRILMADDHPIVLAGLKALVQGDAGLQIVGEARDGRSALRLALSLRPDVLVLDISMPEMNGPEVAKALLAEQPECRILVLTVQEDRATVRQLLDMGVAGYLVKRSAADDLVRAIHAVAGGGTYLDPAIAGKLVGASGQGTSRSPGGPTVELSERETDVLRMIAIGHSNKEISARLALSVKTIETYKARAMEKLGFKTRVEVVRYAAGKGWLPDQ
jgi:DNA-binding NarL/FixJ family response regulator